MKEMYSKKETQEIIGVGFKKVNRLISEGHLIEGAGGITRVSIEAWIGHSITEPESNTPSTADTEVKKLNAETEKFNAQSAHFAALSKLEDWEGRAKEAKEIIGKAEENATLIIHKANEQAGGIKSEAQERMSEARKLEKDVAGQQEKVNIATDKIEGQLELLGERAKAVEKAEDSLATEKRQFDTERDVVRSHQYAPPGPPRKFTLQTEKKGSLLPDNWLEWAIGGVIALGVVLLILLG